MIPLLIGFEIETTREARDSRGEIMSNADPKITEAEAGTGQVDPGPEPPEAMIMAGMAGRPGRTALAHRTLAAATGSFSVRSTPAGQVITSPTRVVLEL